MRREGRSTAEAMLGSLDGKFPGWISHKGLREDVERNEYSIVGTIRGVREAAL